MYYMATKLNFCVILHRLRYFCFKRSFHTLHTSCFHTSCMFQQLMLKRCLLTPYFLACKHAPYPDFLSQKLQICHITSSILWGWAKILKQPICSNFPFPNFKMSLLLLTCKKLLFLPWLTHSNLGMEQILA